MPELEAKERAALSMAREVGLEVRMVPHSHSAAKTEDAVAALGVSQESIIKFLILRSKDPATSVGALLRGNERLNIKKLEALSGVRPLSLGSREYVAALTGFEIGGVPPPAICRCSIRFASETLSGSGTIIGGGGHEYCGMAFDASELRKIPGIRFENIKS